MGEFNSKICWNGCEFKEKKLLITSSSLGNYNFVLFFFQKCKQIIIFIKDSINRLTLFGRN